MTKSEVKIRVNGMIGPILHAARLDTQKSIYEIASELKISVYDLHWIETNPAEAPSCDLYRLIYYYGPGTLTEVARAWQKLNLLISCGS